MVIGEGETDIMAGKLRKNALENCPKQDFKGLQSHRLLYTIWHKQKSIGTFVQGVSEKTDIMAGKLRKNALEKKNIKGRKNAVKKRSEYLQDWMAF